MKALIVLPSYNERDNIVPLVAAILACQPEVRVCVVDDSSPDGTAPALRAAIDASPGWTERVHLIERSHKDGRGGAVRAGLAWGLAEPRFGAFVEMDCDFSHEPRALAEGFRRLECGDDVVIGARYPDGTILGWPASRRAFSFFANALARTLIDRRVADYTNGFRFYSPRAVEWMMRFEQHHKGYIYLSESLSQLIRGGMRISSFPIVFKNRERGQSNTSAAEIRAALLGILQIGWHHRFGNP